MYVNARLPDSSRTAHPSSRGSRAPRLRRVASPALFARNERGDSPSSRERRCPDRSCAACKGSPERSPVRWVTYVVAAGVVASASLASLSGAVLSAGWPSVPPEVCFVARRAEAARPRSVHDDGGHEDPAPQRSLPASLPHLPAAVTANGAARRTAPEVAYGRVARRSSEPRAHDPGY